MHSLFFYNNAKKQLSKLPDNVQKRMINSLERIKIRPFHFIKRKEGTPYFILRIGEYRIILDVKRDKMIIIVIEIGHRKNIYKK